MRLVSLESYSFSTGRSPTTKQTLLPSLPTPPSHPQASPHHHHTAAKLPTLFLVVNISYSSLLFIFSFFRFFPLLSYIISFFLKYLFSLFFLRF
jgi:hypothetical protein